MTSAPLRQQRLLIDLQSLDSRLARLAHERTHLPVLRRIEATVERLRANRRDAVVAAGVLADAKAESTRAEDEVGQVVRRAEILRERLSSGTAGARDLSAIQGGDRSARSPPESPGGRSDRGHGGLGGRSGGG